MIGDVVFVFGSNLAGRHGKGAAKHAKEVYYAEYGVGSGRTGMAYAIPTKGGDLSVLPLKEIASHVRVFLEYADSNKDLLFKLTKVGCGLAGYSEEDISPMFYGAGSNIELPEGWER